MTLKANVKWPSVEFRRVLFCDLCYLINMYKNYLTLCKLAGRTQLYADDTVPIYNSKTYKAMQSQSYPL